MRRPSFNLVLISVIGRGDPNTILWLGVLDQFKNVMTSSGIEKCTRQVHKVSFTHVPQLANFILREATAHT
jgi:hypothetical protein